MLSIFSSGLWACQTTPSEPESKIVVVQETKHAAPAAGDFENLFQCCSDPDITEMLDSYLKLQEAMAGDDEKQSVIYGGLFHTPFCLLRVKNMICSSH